MGQGQAPTLASPRLSGARRASAHEQPPGSGPSGGSGGMKSPEEIVRDIVDIHRRLTALDCLEPGETVNRLFQDLVGITLLPEGPWLRPILGDPRVGALREDLWR